MGKLKGNKVKSSIKRAAVAEAGPAAHAVRFKEINYERPKRATNAPPDAVDGLDFDKVKDVTATAAKTDKGITELDKYNLLNPSTAPSSIIQQRKERYLNRAHNDFVYVPGEGNLTMTVRCARKGKKAVLSTFELVQKSWITNDATPDHLAGFNIENLCIALPRTEEARVVMVKETDPVSKEQYMAAHVVKPVWYVDSVERVDPEWDTFCPFMKHSSILNPIRKECQYIKYMCVYGSGAPVYDIYEIEEDLDDALNKDVQAVPGFTSDAGVTDSDPTVFNKRDWVSSRPHYPYIKDHRNNMDYVHSEYWGKAGPIPDSRQFMRPTVDGVVPVTCENDIFAMDYVHHHTLTVSLNGKNDAQEATVVDVPGFWTGAPQFTVVLKLGVVDYTDSIRLHQSRNILGGVVPPIWVPAADQNYDASFMRISAITSPNMMGVVPNRFADGNYGPPLDDKGDRFTISWLKAAKAQDKLYQEHADETDAPLAGPSTSKDPMPKTSAVQTADETKNVPGFQAISGSGTVESVVGKHIDFSDEQSYSSMWSVIQKQVQSMHTLGTAKTKGIKTFELSRYVMAGVLPEYVNEHQNCPTGVPHLHT